MKESGGLKIKTLGDPILRKKAKPVDKVTGEHRLILSQMAKSMYEDSGIGLAAPQIGSSCQLIVVDIGEGLYKLANPKIVKKEGYQAITEGCLSVPGISIKVKRSKKIWLEAKDENNNPVKIEAKDLFACVLQHEIDHLKGKLIIDYSSFFEKFRLKKKLKALKKL
ncbi:MAG: peptide deformylase [Candidatus Omnitrophota bacterium]